MKYFHIHEHKEKDPGQHLVKISPLARITISDIPANNPTIHYDNTEHKLYIGKFCSIAQKTQFYMGGNHNIKRITTYVPPASWKEQVDHSRNFFSKGDIRIENDVWIGDGAIIMSGVTVGTGAVIGAYSVVTKNVEPYSIVAGNPATFLKKRFTEEQIEILLKSKWWDWNAEKILQNQNIIFGEDFEKFKDLVKEKE